MRIAAPCLAWILACGCASTGIPDPTPADGAGRLTLERLLSRPTLTGTPPSAPLWSPDSHRLAFLWNAAADARREVWLVEADGSGRRRLTDEAEGSSGVESMAWMPDSSELR